MGTDLIVSSDRLPVQWKQEIMGTPLSQLHPQNRIVVGDKMYLGEMQDLRFSHACLWGRVFLAVYKSWSEDRSAEPESLTGKVIQKLFSQRPTEPPINSIRQGDRIWERIWALRYPDSDGILITERGINDHFIGDLKGDLMTEKGILMGNTELLTILDPLFSAMLEAYQTAAHY